MFKDWVVGKVKKLNGKKTLEAKIPRTLNDKIEKVTKYSPEVGERAIYNYDSRFTNEDDVLCRVKKKEYKKGKGYRYTLELIENKKTKSEGVPEVEWDSGIIYEDVSEENIISLLELFTY